MQDLPTSLVKPTTLHGQAINGLAPRELEMIQRLRQKRLVEEATQPVIVELQREKK
jgi:hypothetical protein